MKRLGLILALGLTLSACAATTNPVDTAPPTGNAPAASGAVANSPAVGSSAAAKSSAQAPSGGSKVGTTNTFFKSWADDIGYVHYMIVIEVKNTGGKPADIHSGDQSYTILATDGTVLQTGNFSYSFPQVLAPGQLGYYIEGGQFDQGTKLANVGKLQPSLSYSDSDKTPTPWEFSSVKVATDSLFGGAEVSGIVKNTDTTDATMGTVGVVLFDASGNIMGGVVDNTDVMDLRAGQSKGFKTSYPQTPKIDPAAVKSFKTFGLDYSFF